MTAKLDDLVSRSLPKAAALGHRMVLLSSGADLAFYVCEDCKLAFAVGCASTAKSSTERRVLEVLTDTALTTRCLVSRS